MKQTDKYLTGRGTVDANGPLAAAASALLRLAHNFPAPANSRIVVIGAVGEENSSRGAYHLLDTLKPAPSEVIIAEPSRPERITLGYRGCLRGTFSVQTSFAHGASENLSAPDQLHSI